MHTAHKKSKISEEESDVHVGIWTRAHAGIGFNVQKT